jgi:hypothetical protein
MWNRIEFAALFYITVPTRAFIGDRESVALSPDLRRATHATVPHR